jgi:hypothetical protein
MKGLSQALLAVGIVLVDWGGQASESLSSEWSRLLTGSPNYKTVWLLMTGSVAVALGLWGLARGLRFAKA